MYFDYSFLDAGIWVDTSYQPPRASSGTDEDQILIALMRITGAGESGFNAKVTQHPEVGIGNELNSCRSV